MTSKLNDLIDYEKNLILSKFLLLAPFDGWNYENLKKSSKEIGFDDYYHDLLFPEGVRDLILYFHQQNNQKLAELFCKTSLNQPGRTNAKITHLLELKLSIYQENREAVRCLLNYNLVPTNLLFAKKILWQNCDHIWRLAGDNSNDFNYYSKRILLAGVYGASFLYFLSDESENLEESKKFIARSIYNVSKIGKAKHSFLNLVQNLRHEI